VAKKYRGSSIKRGNYVDFVGSSELLKKIEAAGGRVDEAVKKCVDNSLEQVGMKMQLFMMEHRESGDTYASYEQIKAVSKGNEVVAAVGYNVKEGGLPAIFLDVGTPKQKPHFFRYYAVENSQKQIEEIQQETLNEILRGLK
jgi:hypothetical protein